MKCVDTVKKNQQYLHNTTIAMLNGHKLNEQQRNGMEIATIDIAVADFITEKRIDITL